ncbi:SMC-Scp complex subunit ScpB [Mammaliicoccus sp. Dog046]|uniref:SMC-Scp complex subunit ScpB n=1 Tax=Mammaliicoccus sp. Dog046 TaxID=3034233 RepID=UPI002B261C2B|nr:SMC-Scp complex subunit ScpB [Mammaliicoccus sp. Dog046]WQK84294.1 SMC-Scp complex subunit ScpB [Mammaliicoccus sp. Dog046]
MEVSKLGLLEGLLYSLGDEGIDTNQLCEILELTPVQLKELAETYERETLQITFYGSKCILTAKPIMHPYLEQLMIDNMNTKLSQAALETLSIIAYNQPVTRSDIEMIRGVNSDASVKTLIAKGVIESKHNEQSRSQLLFTTDYFLNVFGLTSLDELPKSTNEENEQEEMDLFFSSMNDQTNNEEQ